MRVFVTPLLLCVVLLSTDSKIATLKETLDQMIQLFSLGQPVSEGPLQFTWGNCSSISNATAKIDNATISPDPIPLPGNITASAGGSLTETLKSPIKAEVTLKKKFPIIGYTRIPCIDNIGSCTYDDLCTMIPNTTNCQPPFSTYHIPCQCPFPAGTYYLPPYNIQIPSAKGIPSWLTNGDYYGEVTVTDAAGNVVGCYYAYLSLKEE